MVTTTKLSLRIVGDILFITVFAVDLNFGSLFFHSADPFFLRIKV